MIELPIPVLLLVLPRYLPGQLVSILHVILITAMFRQLLIKLWLAMTSWCRQPIFWRSQCKIGWRRASETRLGLVPASGVWLYPWGCMPNFPSQQVPKIRQQWSIDFSLLVNNAYTRVYSLPRAQDLWPGASPPGCHWCRVSMSSQ